MARSIFISYRRNDSAGHTGRLHDRLTARWGAERVFLDIDNIPPGEDFVEAIDKTLDECVVVVVVVGRRWLERDSDGNNRIDSDDDFHRLEIERALQRKLLVLPVLVGGSMMPRQADLPPSLAPFARINALEIGDKRFHHDSAKLLEVIDRVLAEADKRQATEEKRREAGRRAEEEKRRLESELESAQERGRQDAMRRQAGEDRQLAAQQQAAKQKAGLDEAKRKAEKSKAAREAERLSKERLERHSEEMKRIEVEPPRPGEPRQVEVGQPAPEVPRLSGAVGVQKSRWLPDGRRSSLAWIGVVLAMAVCAYVLLPSGKNLPTPAAAAATNSPAATPSREVCSLPFDQRPLSCLERQE